MIGKKVLSMLFLALVATSAGCAYRHYLGMHGPSTRNHPDIHDAAITQDAQCLGCHSPKNTDGDAPATSHPDFKGCLKCHNDPVKG